MLIEIIAEALNTDPENLREGTELKSIRNWDSMTHMIMITKIEERLNIEFTGDEIATMTTIKDIKDILFKNGKVE
ncbi:acyl carrier protein [Prochlorococcus sp. MIT 1303]|uniref:acyl carrier protein n=1 Tax=Prochlorococcus sp. MIT 1303 TaxID=1723647 RepID=UPI0007B357D6|nr:acyl carrier protein [Prochlorococcus sp. MIT 1303]KZR68957.1 Acyl carrier protein [Prochlorococcus sp. MIT 1303]